MADVAPRQQALAPPPLPRRPCGPHAPLAIAWVPLPGPPPAGVDAGKVMLCGVSADRLAALQSGASEALPGVGGCAGAVLRFWRAGDGSPAPAGPHYSVVLSVTAAQGAALRLAAASLRRDLGLVVGRCGASGRCCLGSCGRLGGWAGRLGARRAGEERRRSRAATEWASSQASVP
jgi:hypothetical protein